MRIFPFILCLLFFIGTNLTAQDATIFEDKEGELVQLSTTFLKDSIQENRIKAEKKFTTELTAVLANKNSFHYPFEELQAVSILYPADSTFRIFTWQLYVDKSDYRYGGLIQMNNAKNQLFPLTDQSNEIAAIDLEFEVLSPENWYGVIYFNLQEYNSKGGKKYLLFGYDGFEFFSKRKVLDVLSFDEAGQPIFGAPAFAKVEEGFEASTKNRLFLEYYSEVAAKLNYDDQMEMIMLDHLVAMKGPKGQGNVNVPDGSYEGYHLKNGVWEFTEKVFTQVSDEPPAPKPIFNQKDNKDLFGKEKKEKKKSSKG